MSIAVDVRLAILSAIIEGFQRSENRPPEQAEAPSGNAGLDIRAQQVRAAELVQERQPSPALPSSQQGQPSYRLEGGDYVRLRKEFIGWDTPMRFAALKDWISINMLAIFRRASGEWKSVNDLIAIVPAYFEPEAEILNGQVLLIGTSGHAEQLALPIDHLDPSSDLGRCFELAANGRSTANQPAVLARSNGRLEVVSKGVVMDGVFSRMGQRRRSDDPQDAGRVVVITRRTSSTAMGKYVWEFLEHPQS